jgi:FtsP/CotA-like multicopper oxidase with cupredoxin domain
LINGNNTSEGTDAKRFEMVFEQGKSYRLRLINTAVDTHFVVALDQHVMQVIAADFVPIDPFTTNVLSIGIGQRYDVIIKATETSGDYWFRANVQSACGFHGAKQNDIKAIVRYNKNSIATPNTTRPVTEDETVWEFCNDIPMQNLKPKVELNVPEPKDFNHTVEFQQLPGQNDIGIVWGINSTMYHSPWEYPSK